MKRGRALRLQSYKERKCDTPKQKQDHTVNSKGSFPEPLGKSPAVELQQQNQGLDKNSEKYKTSCPEKNRFHGSYPSFFTPCRPLCNK